MGGKSTATKNNTGRQTELDIAKGLAIAFMIFDHVLECYASTQLENTVLANVIYFLGCVPAAPVFMFSMGAGFLYSRNRNNYKYHLKRGGIVLAVSYILNVLRGTLPSLVSYFAWDEYDKYSFFEETISIDILQFAGLAMIFWSILVKYNIHKKLYMLAVTVLTLGLLNYVLSPIQTDSILLSALSGLLWGSSELSYFPFLTWIFYPITGYLFATLLIRCADKNRFYVRVFVFSVLIFTLLAILYNLLGINYSTNYDTAYYHHSFLVNIIYGVSVTGWIGVLFFLGKYLLNFIILTLQRWSKNIALIYLIHWVLIGWLDLTIPDDGIWMWEYLLISVIILATSDFLAFQMSKRGIKLF